MSRAWEWVKAHLAAILGALGSLVLGLLLLIAESLKKPTPAPIATPDLTPALGDEHKRATALVQAQVAADARHTAEVQAVAVSAPTEHESQILSMDEQALADEWNKTHEHPGKR